MSCCCWTEPDPFPPQTLRLLAAARTDRGLEREGNEDRAAFADLAARRAWAPPATVMVEAPSRAFAAVVCDGMGGEEGGEIASAAAVDAILGALHGAFATASITSDERLAHALVASIQAASSHVRDLARREPRLARMGTTATLVAATRDRLLCAQVGDSRAYVFRAGELVRLTRDQTMAEALRANGLVSVDDGGVPYGSHVILQAVGASARLDVVVSEAPLAHGDVVLLCSDGLHGVVPDPLIATILGSRPPGEATEALVAAAILAGGPDNVSCIVFRVLE